MPLTLFIIFIISFSLNAQEINKNGNTILMATHDYALLLKYPSRTLKCDETQIFEVVQKTV